MLQFFVGLSTLIALISVVSCKTCSKVATFNAALLYHVDNYTDREPQIANALSDNDADVYCLQEFWLESDVERLLNKLGSVYPYHYSAIHHGPDALRKPLDEESWWESIDRLFTLTSACSTSDIFHFGLSIGHCAYKHGCFAAFRDSSILGAKCITQNCRSKLKSQRIRPQCISCLILMGSGMSEVTEACAPDFTEKHNRLNGPGLVLLSKKPMSKISYTSYFPEKDMGVERGYIEADIQDIGKVVCTHLTAEREIYIEYDMDFTTYKEQQTAEIGQLSTKFRNHLLVGDLNTGPKIENNANEEKNLGWEVEESWNNLNLGEYRASYFQQDGRCTFCADNPLTGDSTNIAIDHILVKGNEVTIDKIQRVLDRTKPSPLSDHYGVQAKICRVE